MEANLANPALCALLLRQTVIGYREKALRGLEFPLAFTVLPIVLHDGIRAMLPYSTATKLHVWVQKHHHVRIGFVEHVQNLVPITKEAIIFGLQHGALQFDGEGMLVAGQRELADFDVTPKSNVADCVKRAYFIGRWFADAGAPASVLNAFEVNIS